MAREKRRESTCIRVEETSNFLNSWQPPTQSPTRRSLNAKLAGGYPRQRGSRRRAFPDQSRLTIEHGLAIEIRQHDEARARWQRLIPRWRRVVRSRGDSVGERSAGRQSKCQGDGVRRVCNHAFHVLWPFVTSGDNFLRVLRHRRPSTNTAQISNAIVEGSGTELVVDPPTTVIADPPVPVGVVTNSTNANIPLPDGPG